MHLFWQGWWPARSVAVVEVNGYTSGPGADLTRATPVHGLLKAGNAGVIFD